MARVRRAGPLIVAVALSLAGAGCRHVAPYERGAIARPDMTPEALDGPAARHANAVHEGALQSGSVAASGCGCN